ncbi:MAG: hypothetical protein H7A31_02590 [Thermotogae bacterium]|nr:hypothetical protein [Thermotogota bacterium]
MEFKCLIFIPDGTIYSSKNYSYKNSDKILIKDIMPEDEKKIFFYPGFNAHFTVEEDNKSISGIKRYLKIDNRTKKIIKCVYNDEISDDVREIYGDYVEIVSKFVGLRKVLSSFNTLIESEDIIESYENWLENISRDVIPEYRDSVSQRITKFVNLYLIRVYERIYGKNINLLKEHESFIAYKILETSLFSKTF